MKQFVIVRSNRLQHENPATTSHACFCIFFEIRDTDKLLAHTNIGVSSFQRLLNHVPDSIPNALKVKNYGAREYNQKLRDHDKFDLP